MATARKNNIVMEFGDEQVNLADVNAAIEKAYVAAGNKASDIKSNEVYYNIEERKAYYVINGEANGDFVEF